jgi:predicted HD phosphohydrolase
MAAGTEADYRLLERYERVYAASLARRMMDVLARLEGSLGGYQVSRLEHSLQAATRARLDGADSDWVVAALLHDIGDELAPYNHSEFAAAVLRPYVREEVTWVVEQHGVFQSYYYAHHLGGSRDGRDAVRDHPWFDLCREFCARWDQNSFDPDFVSDPLESFEAQVRSVFARPAWDPGARAAGESPFAR